MILDKVRVWLPRKDIENILRTLREHNYKRIVYVSLEGGKDPVESLTDSELVSEIVSEAMWTTQNLQTGDAYNKPPPTEEEFEKAMLDMMENW